MITLRLYLTVTYVYSQMDSEMLRSMSSQWLQEKVIPIWQQSICSIASLGRDLKWLVKQSVRQTELWDSQTTVCVVLITSPIQQSTLMYRYEPREPPLQWFARNQLSKCNIVSKRWWAFKSMAISHQSITDKLKRPISSLHCQAI